MSQPFLDHRIFSARVPVKSDKDDRDRQEIHLLTYNPEHHMNIYVYDSAEHHVFDMCLSGEHARLLRDGLIEAYPLEVKK